MTVYCHTLSRIKCSVSVFNTVVHILTTEIYRVNLLSDSLTDLATVSNSPQKCKALKGVNYFGWLYQSDGCGAARCTVRMITCAGTQDGLLRRKGTRRGNWTVETARMNWYSATDRDRQMSGCEFDRLHNLLRGLPK
jgi:hypothetical protein